MAHKRTRHVTHMNAICECHIYERPMTRVLGLPIRDCARGCNNRSQMCLHLSTIDVIEKTFFERLYLVIGMGTFGPWVNCPYAPTTPTVYSTTISWFLCNFFPGWPLNFCHQDSPSNLAESVTLPMTHMDCNAHLQSEPWVVSNPWVTHVTHRNVLCQTYVWLMSRIWMSHDTHRLQRSPTIWTMSQVKHLNDSCHVYEWVRSNIWVTHVTYMNESWHTQTAALTYNLNHESSQTFEWLMSRTWMS